MLEVKQAKLTLEDGTVFTGKSFILHGNDGVS